MQNKEKQARQIGNNSNSLASKQTQELFILPPGL